jgi:apolipoprotein D and lipocalin family protein
MINARFAALWMTVLLASNAVAGELETVPFVDLERYMGRWFEIARLPNEFQEGCDRAEALYALEPEGTVRVVNTCFAAGGDEPRSVEGVAEVVDGATNAKLRVSFLPPWLRWTGLGWGDYWVVMLDEGYQYAVVSEPRRRYLWVLAREPQLPDATWASIREELERRGFALDDLIVGGAGVTGEPAASPPH